MNSDHDHEKMEEARDGEDTMEINEMEQTKVRLMRAYVESQDPSSQVLLTTLSPLFYAIG